MMSSNKIHVVYATDTRYLLPTLVAASSAVAWASDPSRIVIDILDVGITDAAWHDFERRLHLKFGAALAVTRHSIDQKKFTGLGFWHGSQATFARLCIPNILADCDWCVYGDGDTLFTDDPLKLIPLCDDSKAILGHADWPQEIPPQATWFKSLGLAWEPDQYVCAGFLLMNLKWFRENDGVNKCFAYLNAHPDSPFNDQDALYVVCKGHVGFLPDAWGMFSWHIAEKDAPRPSCIHYANERPWDFKLSRHFGYMYVKRLWLDYAEQLLAMQPRDFGGPGAFGWLLMRSYSWCVRTAFCALSWSAFIRKRYSWAYHRFAQRAVRCECHINSKV